MARPRVLIHRATRQLQEIVFSVMSDTHASHPDFEALLRRALAAVEPPATSPTA